ncbi:hypothetical protein Trydic_g587 [Trypoxylus dichotomus]
MTGKRRRSEVQGRDKKIPMGSQQVQGRKEEDEPKKKVQQTNGEVGGASMRSPLSPALVNLFMENFEIETIRTTRKKPKFWLRQWTIPL